MASKFKWSEDKIKQLEAEGRGKGKGATYLPWLEVSDFPSLGESRRIYSRLTGREHHLVSKVEWKTFVLMEASPDVTDIREQFPLPRNETLAIAAQLGIKHPIYPGTKVPVVMTMDFLITRQHSEKKILQAYDCKGNEDAENERALEKLEIHRAWCNGCGIPHNLVFDSMLPKNKVRALEWIRSANLAPGEVEPYPNYYHEHQARVFHELATNNRRAMSLAQFCDNYDSRAGAVPGTGLRTVRMLLADRRLVTDLSQPDIAASPLSMFRSVTPGVLHLAMGA